MTVVQSGPRNGSDSVEGTREVDALAQPRPQETSHQRSKTVDVPGRIGKLNTASQRKVIEPDDAVTGTFGSGQVLPLELMSIADLDLGLAAQDLATLSREEVASILQEGIRFEAVLMAGFGIMIADAQDFADPRITYMLHEMGEETRHSRLFARLAGELAPKARNPLSGPLLRLLFRAGAMQIIRRPALLFTLVLGGEEIPDLFQKLAAEHPLTDPVLRDLSRYHRQEEARHLAYARLVLPEIWKEASMLDRFLVRRLAPLVIGGMFANIVHPGVYATVGLPSWQTWRSANRSPGRVALRHQATRPILQTLVQAGAVRCGSVPRGWRRLCGVDATGEGASATMDPC